MADTCVPRVIVIDTTIKQLETNISLIFFFAKAICCLQACNVVQGQR